MIFINIFFNSTEQISGQTGDISALIVVRVGVKYVYQNNQRTDVLEGKTVTVVMPLNSYEQMTVVIPSGVLGITKEDIEGRRRPYLASFDGFYAEAYAGKYGLGINAKATSVIFSDMEDEYMITLFGLEENY